MLLTVSLLAILPVAVRTADTLSTVAASVAVAVESARIATVATIRAAIAAVAGAQSNAAHTQPDLQLCRLGTDQIVFVVAIVVLISECPGLRRRNRRFNGRRITRRPTVGRNNNDGASHHQQQRHLRATAKLTLEICNNHQCALLNAR